MVIAPNVLYLMAVSIILTVVTSVVPYVLISHHVVVVLLAINLRLLLFQVAEIKQQRGSGYVEVSLQNVYFYLETLSSTLQAFNHTPEGLIRIFAHIVPILNGRDSEGHVIYLGPQRTKIHRYLLIIFLAKSAQMFRLSGKEIDNSIYFTLYALKEIANSFKDIWFRSKTALTISPSIMTGQKLRLKYTI